MFFLLFYVFFDVESESEVRFGRSPLVLSYKNNALDRHKIPGTGCNFSFQCNKLKKKFLFKQKRDSYSSFNRASFVTFVTAKVTI